MPVYEVRSELDDAWRTFTVEAEDSEEASFLAESHNRALAAAGELLLKVVSVTDG